MRVTIFTLHNPYTGRTYPSHALTTIMDEYKKHRVLLVGALNHEVITSIDEDVEQDLITHCATDLVADATSISAKIMPVRSGVKHARFGVSGTGEVDDDGNVSGFKFVKLVNMS